MKRVAVLGAAGTGKTRLVSELSNFLAANGLRDIAVEAGGAPDAAATLLTGLDLFPPDADACAEDARLRAQLQAAGRPYQVVYGTGEARLRSALRALAAAGLVPLAQLPGHEKGGASRAWIVSCEKCSDPDCEHRLFTRLRSER